MKHATLALMAMLMTVGPAFGHAKLLNSSPAADAQLQAAPKVLAITFSEEAQLVGLKLSKGAVAVPLAFERQPKAATRFTVSLPPLDPGTYEVQWTAVAADDGHITKGRFSFSIAGGTSLSTLAS
jgi:methionine-rich copper-binding protein CopC